MSTEIWGVEVAGKFNCAAALLDIETRKVNADKNFPFSKRWSVMMVGLAFNNEIFIVSGEDEVDLLDETSKLLADAEKIIYSATREFDEMILKGRFTNARRAHLPAAAYPALPNAENFKWINAKNKTKLPRSEADCISKEIPNAWARGEWEAVAVHNLRDVAELILLNGSPDAECTEWCNKVLRDDEFAVKMF